MTLRRLQYSPNGEEIFTRSVETNKSFEDIINIYCDKNDNLIFYTYDPAEKILKINADGTFDNSFEYDNSNLIVTDIYEKNDLYFLSGGVYNSDNNSIDRIFITAIDRQGNQDNQFGIFIESNENLKLTDQMIVNDDHIIVAGTYIDDTINKKIVAKYKMNTLSTINNEDISIDFVLNNPLKDEFLFKSKQEIAKIEIYNMIGQKIHNVHHNQENISHIPRGRKYSPLVRP